MERDSNVIPVFFICKGTGFMAPVQEEGYKYGISIAFLCRNIRTAIECYQQCPATIVVMDAHWPACHLEFGYTILENIIKVNPNARVIGHSTKTQLPIPKTWQQSGGWGYFHRSKGIEDIASIVKRVHAGEKYFIYMIAIQKKYP